MRGNAHCKGEQFIEFLDGGIVAFDLNEFIAACLLSLVDPATAKV